MVSRKILRIASDYGRFLRAFFTVICRNNLKINLKSLANRDKNRFVASVY